MSAGDPNRDAELDLKDVTPEIFLRRQKSVHVWLEKVINKKIGLEDEEGHEKDILLDFAATLRDGVVLCQTMLVIEPRSIPKYHSRKTIANSIPVMKENVFFFIEACADYGVPKHRLFHEDDLCFSKNLLKVLECIEALANLAHERGFAIGLELVGDNAHYVAALLHLNKSTLLSVDLKLKEPRPLRLPHIHPNQEGEKKPSFSPCSHRHNYALEHARKRVVPAKSCSPVVKESEFSKEIYEGAEEMLKGIRNRTAIEQQQHSQAAKHLNTLVNSRGPEAEKIERGFILMQARARGMLDRKHFKKRQRFQQIRKNVAKEILKTEEVYVNNLKLLHKVYKEPLLTQGIKKALVTLDEIKVIFSDAEIILGYNSQLLEDIRPRVENWDASTMLGDIFLQILSYLKVYTGYVKNYDLALEVLGELRKKRKFEQLLYACKENPENSGHDIEALLILPIQRIPRYSLLLAELIKYTWKDHRDYANLVEAQKKMHDVASYVNEKKREYENIQMVRQIQNSFVGSSEVLVDPTRKFVRSDVVAVWTGSNDTEKKQQELVLNLFNDLIVVSTQVSKRGTLKFKETIKVASVSVKEPKMRKWTIKRGESGKMWPTRGTGTPEASPSAYRRSNSIVGGESRRNSVGSMGSDYGGRRNSGADLGRKNSMVCTYSVKNTVELVNSLDHTVLKVCFESPLAHAGWVCDFKKAKSELEQIALFHEGVAMERAVQRSETAKKSISTYLMKSMDERKADWRKSRGRSQDSSDSPKTEDSHSEENS